MAHFQLRKSICINDNPKISHFLKQAETYLTQIYENQWSFLCILTQEIQKSFELVLKLLLSIRDNDSPKQILLGHTPTFRQSFVWMLILECKHWDLGVSDSTLLLFCTLPCISIDISWTLQTAQGSASPDPTLPRTCFF